MVVCMCELENDRKEVGGDRGREREREGGWVKE